MINRRRRYINETSFCRRHTDRREVGRSAQGGVIYAPTDMKVPPFVDPAPHSYEPPDRGGKFGGAGASGSWDSPSPSSTPDFSNVDSGSSSTAPSSD